MNSFDRWLRRFGEWLLSARSVSATYVTSLEPAAQRYGLDQIALLQEIGITAEQLLQPGYRIPLFHAFRLAELAAERSGDPCFGLEVGKEVQARSFQVLGYSAMSCRTLAGAIERLQRYEKLVWDVGVSELDLEGDTAVLKLVPEGVSMVPEQVIEMSISGWVHFGNRILRDPQPPKEVRFRHARIGPQARYEEILGCPVSFEHPNSQIRFPERMLDAPLAGADPALLSMMDLQGERLLAEYAQDTNLVNETRAAICGMLKEGEPDLASVAAKLDMTPRILRRRLANSATNFQSLLDGVRRDLALNYIRNTEMSLLDVAFMLGFSDQSAFNRAFRRWTGQAPGQYKASGSAGLPGL